MDAPFESVNVLEEDAIRNGMKAYSQWPTFPQVYIDGEFFGGCDIMIGALCGGWGWGGGGGGGGWGGWLGVSGVAGWWLGVGGGVWGGWWMGLGCVCEGLVQDVFKCSSP